MARRIDSQRALIQLEEGEGHRSGRLAISISRLGISHDSWWRRARPAQRWLSVARTPLATPSKLLASTFPGTKPLVATPECAGLAGILVESAAKSTDPARG